MTEQDRQQIEYYIPGEPDSSLENGERVSLVELKHCIREAGERKGQKGTKSAE